MMMPTVTRHRGPSSVKLSALATLGALGASGLLAPSRALAAPRQVAHEAGLWLAATNQPAATRLMTGGPAPITRQAFARLTAQQPAWQGMFDSITGVPSRLWGGSQPAPGANASPTIAEAAARAFIADHLDLLAPGAAMADLELVTNVEEQGIRTVAFLQYAAGLRVVGGQLSVSFKRDRLFVARSAALPHVKTGLGRQATAPTVDGMAARGAATTWLSQIYGGTVTAADVSEAMILPVLRAGYPVDYRVVTRVRVDSYQPRGQWDVYIDVTTQQPVARRQRLHFGTGTVQYNAPVRWPGGTRQAYAVPFANFTVNGQATEADANGQLQWVGEDPVSVDLGLTSRYARIINEGGSLAAATQTLASGGIFEWIHDTTEFLDAQLTAFVHANIAKRYALTLAPDLPWLSEVMRTYVNSSEDSCNAYAQPGDFSSGKDWEIHFLRGDGQCENTARLADVVYHEFGHGFHYESKLAGVGDDDGSLSEGVSDYYAATITGDHGMGRGFFYSEEALRDLDPEGTEKVWPDDVSNFDPHGTGEIIAGTLWDLRKAAIAEMGETEGVQYANQLYLGLIRRASDLPSTYVEALAFDDDDGDLGNGTPNYCLIAGAFGPHGLAANGPGVTISQPTFDGTEVAFTATSSNIDRCPAPTVSAAELEWTLRDGAGGGVLDLTADGTHYAASIPAQENGAVVRYRVRVSLSDGSQIQLPRNPVDDYYEYYVGPTTPIYCTDFESDPNWSLTATSAPNTWEIGAPAANAGNGEPVSAVSGSKILSLGLGAAYQAGGTYMAISPAIEVDTTKYAKVRIQYQRWLEVEDASYDQATVKIANTPVWANHSGLGEDHHRDGEWRFHDIDITNDLKNLAAETNNAAAFPLKVSFTLKSDEGLEFAGWAMDDFCVVGVSKADAGPCTGDDCEAEDDGSGCCSANQGLASPLLLALGVVALAWRRRRAQAGSGASAA